MKYVIGLLLSVLFGLWSFTFYMLNQDAIDLATTNAIYAYLN